MKLLVEATEIDMDGPQCCGCGSDGDTEEMIF